jgi:urocanate hydratase
MYRCAPDYEMRARPIDEYPGNAQAKAIMLMIQII